MVQRGSKRKRQEKRKGKGEDGRKGEGKKEKERKTWKKGGKMNGKRVGKGRKELKRVGKPQKPSTEKATIRKEKREGKGKIPPRKARQKVFPARGRTELCRALIS